MRHLVLAIACTQLSGCFFVFIPGSLMAKAGDAMTGAKGEHCVPAQAKVGDSITLGDGRVLVVQSLSGTSSRCQNPLHPVRAELTPA
jgi:hypothetical protein